MNERKKENCRYYFNNGDCRLYSYFPCLGVQGCIAYEESSVNDKVKVK